MYENLSKLYKIEYDIKLNEHGRPYVQSLNEISPENKFFVIEAMKSILEDVYNRKNEEFDFNTSKIIEDTIMLLCQIGDNVAEIMWNQMKALGEAAFILADKYHIIVETIEQRNQLGSVNVIFFDNKLFEKQIGLKVMVKSENCVFELIDLTKNKWKKIIL